MNMNKSLSIIFSVLLLILNLNYMYSSTNEFQLYLKEANMTFISNTNYVEVPVVENEDILYQYAIKNYSKDVEIRYSIFPYSKENKAKINVNNAVYKEFFMAVALNIAGKEENLKKVTVFKTSDVMSEFHANWGASFIIIPESEFSKGYSNCVMTALHRDNVAYALIIFLFNKPKDFIP